MNLYDYIFLKMDEQANEWSVNAQFLATRTDGICVVNLYALHNFYVESYYNTQTNTIERLRPFRSVSQLEPYLSAISVEKLLGWQQQSPNKRQGFDWYGVFFSID